MNTKDFEKYLLPITIFSILEILIFIIDYSFDLFKKSNGVLILVLNWIPIILFGIFYFLYFTYETGKSSLKEIYIRLFKITWFTFGFTFLFNIIFFFIIDTEFKSKKIEYWSNQEIQKLKDIESAKNVEIDYSEDEIKNRHLYKFTMGGIFKSHFLKYLLYSIFIFLVAAAVHEKT